MSEPLAVRCAGLKREVNQKKLFLLIKMFKIFLKTILTHVFKIKKSDDTGRQKRRHGTTKKATWGQRGVLMPVYIVITPTHISSQLSVTGEPKK